VPAYVPNSRPSWSNQARQERSLRGACTPEEGQKIVTVAITWIDTPYSQLGGHSKKGKFADCSGSTHAIYEEAGLPYPYQRTKDFADYAAKTDRFKPAPGNTPQVGDVGYWRNASEGHMVIYDDKAYEHLTKEQLKKGGFAQANTWSATGSKHVYQATPQPWFDKKYGPVKWYRYCLDK